MSYLMFPDQLSIRLRAEGHHLPIRNRHFDDKVQILVLVLLVPHILALLVGDETLSFSPGITAGQLSLQEVHPRLHLRKELQLKVANTEVPPGIS